MKRFVHWLSPRSPAGLFGRTVNDARIGNYGQSTMRRPDTAPLGTGLRLRSAKSGDECLLALDKLQAVYRTRQYVHMPYLVACGHQWLADAPAPTRAVAASDSVGNFLMVALWPREHGTEMGIFPLGSGNDRLWLPIIEHWLDEDGSMTKAGVIRARSVALAPPEIPHDYVRETLRLSGYPVTDHNVACLQEMNARQFLIKAAQFLGTSGERSAQVFLADHQDCDDLQKILSDLAAEMPDALPYMQDLPWRIRALLLEPDHRASPFWAGMQPAV